VGSDLAPHSDGTKKCDDTGLVSTHTMLLYLTDCDKGGETLLLRSAVVAPLDDSSSSSSPNTNDDDNLIYATQPRRGRILLFPHATPHAGAPVVSVPKICLRAEVHISRQSSRRLPT
jgi:2OG-Fe(II) oxygenase superfamily